MSPFFRAALDGEFKEALDCAMTLPDDKEETFERFLGWLYFKEYNIQDWILDKSNDFWVDIIDDHIFSDKVQAQAFQEVVIDKALFAYRFSEARPMGLKTISKIYREAPDTSTLRMLAVSMYECISPQWFREPHVVRQLEAIPRFAAELVRKLAESGCNARERRTLVAEDFYTRYSGKLDSQAGEVKKK